ncbi:MAG: response regulator, partial [Candidatus Hermodarchaeia archaeon]
FEKGLDIAYVIDERTPLTIAGDITRLRQILLNLLSNAVKFTEQGEVVLNVGLSGISESKKSGPDGAQPITSGEHTINFAVKDTGIGIAPDRMNRLFQSFSQVDASTARKYGGTGLGLAISKRLSLMMGGDLWVESELGEGSTFHFSIFAEAIDAPKVKRAKLQGVQPALRGKRVLIVDDNETNRKILVLQTQSWGMIPTETELPKEALKVIEAGAPFDVAILDMHMPDMDGMTLAEEIRKHRDSDELPLVLFTSLGRREIGEERVDFAIHLTKPIKPSQLYNGLIEIFAGKAVSFKKSDLLGIKTDSELASRLPLRILLAEDNVINQKLALRLLLNMGYRADVAANGLEAIQSLERQTYDVILMDVQMPEMDGLEATRQIVKRWNGIERPRIIAMTANAMAGDREKCIEAGMDDYITKPIRVADLVGALSKTIPVAE